MNTIKIREFVEGEPYYADILLSAVIAIEKDDYGVYIITNNRQFTSTVLDYAELLKTVFGEVK